jgi:putative alpha-1,2-mannosidase
VSSYAYEDDAISGFIGTHQPAIWMGDYGYVTLMPEVGRSAERRVSAPALLARRRDRHALLLRGQDGRPNGARRIVAEITATDHCGYLRFTFPARKGGSVLVEATRAGVEGWVKADAQGGEIVGYNPDRMDAHLSSLKAAEFQRLFRRALPHPSMMPASTRDRFPRRAAKSKATTWAPSRISMPARGR